MSSLSKFFKVTNQIMIEYIADLYLVTDLAKRYRTNYTVYTGIDDNVYYTEKPRDIDDIYRNALFFIKFPDESESEYTYLGLEKENGLYTNQTFIDNELPAYVKSYKSGEGNMHYDKIRIHFIYGFLLDGLAGFTLLIKVKAKYLGPVLKTMPNSTTSMVFDNYGNPVFNTDYYGKDTMGNPIYKERLVFNEKDFTLLDYFFPKEALNFKNVVKWHKSPIYQNGAFYDRYIEIDVPSAYFLSLDAAANNIILSVNNPYGFYMADETNVPYYDDVNDKYYADVPKTLDEINKRIIIYTIEKDPTLIVNFATVSETNLKPITAQKSKSGIYGSSLVSRTYASQYYQDPINLIAIKYKSNSDFFNVRIYEDIDNNEIVYYPVYGEGDNAKELSYDVFNEIELGTIPMMTEGFYDKLSGIEDFYNTYGENAYKWIIYNDISVTYNYSKNIRNLDADATLGSSYTLHFTNIIDYGIENPELAGSFWISSFIPKVPTRNNMFCDSIVISYTCRLINRVTSVEAIRNATLRITDVQRYVSKRIAINNVTTYKIVNQIKRNELKMTTVQKESNNKYILSFYDATNLVVKDMGNNNLYTLGQMVLYLKHTSSNYLFRLYTLNEDNVRIPYDLTGPFRYKLVFPTNAGNKIEIYPNTDNGNLNLGIGQLVFHITEDLVKRIMNVSKSDRYFAIMTDVENQDSMESTLYEGQVSYYI